MKGMAGLVEGAVGEDVAAADSVEEEVVVSAVELRRGDSPVEDGRAEVSAAAAGRDRAAEPLVAAVPLAIAVRPSVRRGEAHVPALAEALPVAVLVPLSSREAVRQLAVVLRVADFSRVHVPELVPGELEESVWDSDRQSVAELAPDRDLELEIDRRLDQAVPSAHDPQSVQAPSLVRDRRRCRGWAVELSVAEPMCRIARRAAPKISRNRERLAPQICRIAWPTATG